MELARGTAVLELLLGAVEKTCTPCRGEESGRIRQSLEMQGRGLGLEEEAYAIRTGPCKLDKHDKPAKTPNHAVWSETPHGRLSIAGIPSPKHRTGLWRLDLVEATGLARPVTML